MLLVHPYTQLQRNNPWPEGRCGPGKESTEINKFVHMTDLFIQAYIGAVDNQLDVGHVHKLMSVVNWSTDYGGGIAIQCLEEGGKGSWEFNVFC